MRKKFKFVNHWENKSLRIEKINSANWISLFTQINFWRLFHSDCWRIDDLFPEVTIYAECIELFESISSDAVYFVNLLVTMWTHQKQALGYLRTLPSPRSPALRDIYSDIERIFRTYDGMEKYFRAFSLFLLCEGRYFLFDSLVVQGIVCEFVRKQ